MSQNDSFFGGAEALSFPKANNGVYTDTRLRGVVRGGLIVGEPEIQQMTEMGKGTPLYWDAERTRPKNQMIVTLICDGRGGALDERQPGNAHDSGKRRLYIRGYMVTAVGDALAAAGAEGLRPGGELYVCWIDEKPSKTLGFDPARVWAARYIPGSVSVPTGPNGAPQVPQNGLSGAPAANPWDQQQSATQPQFNQPQPNAPAAQGQQPAAAPWAPTPPPSGPTGMPEPVWGNGPAQGQPVTNPYVTSPAAQQQPPANPYANQQQQPAPTAGAAPNPWAQ
jgi:hypothetical protein